MTPGITPKERFKEICSFNRKNDFFTFGLHAWNDTFKRWIQEGMPVKNMENKKEFHMFTLGYDNQIEGIIPNAAITGLGKNVNPPWVPPLVPMFVPEIIEDTADEHGIVTLKDFDGAIVRRNKDDIESMPEYLEYPVTDKLSWDEYKKRLDPETPERFPAGWEIMTDDKLAWPIKPEHVGKHFEERDFPLGMNVCSLLGMPRNYMGIVNLSYTMADNPVLIEEMIEWQAYFAVETLKKVFAAGITLDWAWIWEDIAFNNGPLISPDYVRRLAAPHYRKVSDMLHANGVSAIIVDCDGNVDDLLPVWLDNGINATYPLECASGMDARNFRRKYGKDLLIFGNIDKRKIAMGKNEIDEELVKVRELMEFGGFFPGCDHHFPPDISYENFRYLMNGIYQLSDYPELRRTL